VLSKLWTHTVLAGALLAQTPYPREDSQSLLFEVRKKLQPTINALPKYVCTETIDRSTLAPKSANAFQSCRELEKPGGGPYVSDRLRVDVAVEGENEMYSWMGENSFEDVDLASLVGSGAISTGAFGSFLASIFGSDAASYTFNGSVTVDGRELVEFGYRIPRALSRYRVGTGGHRVVVGYDGVFRVDPKTFDLVSLVIHADQLPPELTICAATTTLNYDGRRARGAFDFVLPQAADLHLTMGDGREFVNHTVFSGCKEFVAESSISFDATTRPTTTRVSAMKTAGPLALSAGLLFRVALTRPIDTATAAAGDEIEGQFMESVKDKTTQAVIPKGAEVRVRIVRVRRDYGPGRKRLTIALKVETLRMDGAARPFHARLGTASQIRMIGKDLSQPCQSVLGTDGGFGFLTFPNAGPRYILKRGFAIDGITLGDPAHSR